MVHPSVGGVSFATSVCLGNTPNVSPESHTRCVTSITILAQVNLHNQYSETSSRMIRRLTTGAECKYHGGKASNETHVKLSVLLYYSRLP